MHKPTPDFIWEMREQVTQLRKTWSKFPSGHHDCSEKQHAQWTNVSRIIDLLQSNIEFAAESLRGGDSMNADDWTKTKGAGLTSDTSALDSGAEYQHGQKKGQTSSSITPLVKVSLPTQEQADAVWGIKRS